MLQDYVKKAYPEKLHDSVLKTLIKDKDARTAALEHRQQLLTSRVPGDIDKPGVGFDYKVNYEDVLKAREAAMSNKGDMKLRKKYLDINSSLRAPKERRSIFLGSRNTIRSILSKARKVT